MESPQILRVGLTGGIASGKTTVARLLAELGALVIDADELARLSIEPGGSAYDGVVARFGREILDERHRIVRARLAERVFSEPDARAALNALVHPQVLAEADRRIAEYASRGRAPLAVFDAALLVESGAHRDFHRLVVVRCDPSTQLRRLLARDGMSEREALARIDAQAPLEDKLAVAHYVIDTEGTLRETRRQVEQVYVKLLGDFQQEFGSPVDSPPQSG